MIWVCLYVHECALLERWVYVLCCVSCLSFFLLIFCTMNVGFPLKMHIYLSGGPYNIVHVWWIPVVKVLPYAHQNVPLSKRWELVVHCILVTLCTPRAFIHTKKSERTVLIWRTTTFFSKSMNLNMIYLNTVRNSKQFGATHYLTHTRLIIFQKSQVQD